MSVMKGQIIELLQNATEPKEIEKLKQITRENPKLITSTDSSGNSLLHTSAHVGNTEFMSYLIDSGIQINTQNQLGQTALHVAVAANQVDAVKLLLEKVCCSSVGISSVLGG